MIARYRPRSGSLLGLGFLALFLTGSNVAVAQPTLDSLWPNSTGNSWSYDMTWEGLDGPVSGTGSLFFTGSEIFPPGVEVQNLLGQASVSPTKSDAPHGLSALERHLWRFRPQLRPQFTERARKNGLPYWPMVLLTPMEGSTSEVGYRETADVIGGWRAPLADWSWWMVSGPVATGSTFRLQLVPDLADDVFLNGEIRGIDESVNTQVGTFNGAVVVDYLIELGEITFGDEDGNLIGTGVGEISGWVAFVPDLGPVAAAELTEIVSHDCPTCTPEQLRSFAADASLNNNPVSTTAESFGTLKARF